MCICCCKSDRRRASPPSPTCSKSVSYVANLLKGGTSRILRAEFPELEEFLWGESFWADGYFAESVGQVEGSGCHCLYSRPATIIFLPGIRDPATIIFLPGPAKNGNLSYI